MGLFKRKKKQKEEQIKIEILNETDIISDEINNKEEQNIVDPTVNKSDEQLLDELFFIFSKIESKNARITTEYYTIKILSRIGLKNIDFKIPFIRSSKSK